MQFLVNPTDLDFTCLQCIWLDESKRHSLVFIFGFSSSCMASFHVPGTWDLWFNVFDSMRGRGTLVFSLGQQQWLFPTFLLLLPEQCGANKSLALVASYLCVPAKNDNSCSRWLRAWHWLVPSIQWLWAWLVRFAWTHRLISVIRGIRKFEKLLPCMGNS